MSRMIDGGRLRCHTSPTRKCCPATFCTRKLRTDGQSCAYRSHRGTRLFGAWVFARVPLVSRLDKQLKSCQPLSASLNDCSESDHGLSARRRAAASLGSQGAVPSESAAGSPSGRSSGSPRPPHGAYRPPLQRQRPGPQRPMDSRQAPSQQHSNPPHRQQGLASQQPPGRPIDSRILERPRHPSGDGLARSSGIVKNTTTVNFCLQYHTQYGQRIRLVGSHESLGEQFSHQ